MALYPGATVKPTSWGGRVARNRQGRGILHVAVSERTSYPPYSGNTWHFYVAKAAPDGSTDGSGGPAYCEQYVDTEFRAYGDVDANDDALVVETAGAANPATVNSERWTRAQELRIADLMRWESQQPGGAPLALLPDAKPGRTGWGPHRLGIKHSAGLVPGWWFPGCEVWSTALGKECPGDAKVAQIPLIIAAAAASTQGDDMFTNDDAVRMSRIENAVAALIGVSERPLQVEARLTPKIDALTEVVRQLATKQGAAIDMAAIEAVVEKGVADAIAGIDTTVTVKPAP